MSYIIVFSALIGRLKAFSSAPKIRALLGVAVPGVDVDRGGPFMGTKIRMAAAEIFDVISDVHGLGLPAEEDDSLLLRIEARDLGEHAGLARLHEVEGAQTELVVLDHVQDMLVAVIARLDAVDGVMELRAELGDVSEGFEPLIIKIGGDDERILGAG